MSASPPHASFRVTRRSLLLGLGATLTVGHSRIAFAQAPGERRCVVILLRGGLDGLHVVAPYGDPHHASLRRSIALAEPGREGGLLDLGGYFGLHPALGRLHEMFRQGEAVFLHALAAPHRSRSHFEAQDLLEGGGERLMASGWLNRALQAMPMTGPVRPGLAVGTGVPLLLRGPAPVGAYSPAGLDRPSPDLMYRLAALHDAEPRLNTAFREGMRARGFAEQTLGAGEREQERDSFPRLAAAAGRLLAEPRGPRIAALDLGGWDTHALQGPRIVPPLRALDAGLAALRAALGEHWAQTAVLVVTEFGRTARVNGNAGTDHGTAGVAFLLGGSVAGGRVLADWPGLAPTDLFEGRDLMPTGDVRAVAKAVLAEHLRLLPQAVAQAFPGSDTTPPMAGLFRG
ncbi:DUF1501 domain-containing protein [Rubritepida flocculans]|uniref:DUF1501 domain-containing protein n=1 Tax=Rubritepida flocculans TaxID=182403 RepID=UPI000419ECA5|nr:DUF1501 domain-containing protein [Rubritepida flocculans]